MLTESQEILRLKAEERTARLGALRAQHDAELKRIQSQDNWSAKYKGELIAAEKASFAAKFNRTAQEIAEGAADELASARAKQAKLEAAHEARFDTQRVLLHTREFAVELSLLAEPRDLTRALANMHLSPSTDPNKVRIRTKVLGLWQRANARLGERFLEKHDSGKRR